MKYLMLIKHDERYWQQQPPQALMDAMGKFMDESIKNGTLVDTAGLRPTADGARIDLRGGRMKLTDGPFTEAKEIIGGYAIVDAKSKEHAIEVASKFMDLHRVHWPEFDGQCEIRPLADF